MLLRGILTTRSEAGDELDAGDMFFLFDGTLHHNSGKLQRCFTSSTGDQIDKNCKTVYLSIDEDSLRARRACVKQGASFDQVEYMTVVTKEEFGMQVPVVKGLHYKGTNLGNKIGDIEYDEAETMWKMACKQKHALMGAYRIAVGGKTEGEEIGRGAKRKGADTVEPTFWHSRPRKFYQELIHRYRPKAILDFSMGDGVLALESAKARIPYLGFGLTTTHVELLKAHLVQEMMKVFYTEGEKEYDPELAVLFKTQSAKTEPPTKKTKGATGASGSNSSGDASGSSATNLLDAFKKKLEAFKTNPPAKAATGKEEEVDSPE
jgi:hypothetical protein